MKLTKILMALGVVAMAQGCVQGKKLVDLNESQIDKVCSNATEETVDCGDGVEVTTSGPDACAMTIEALPDSCEATVGDYSDCSDADPCDSDAVMEACAPIFECVSSGSM